MKKNKEFSRKRAIAAVMLFVVILGAGGCASRPAPYTGDNVILTETGEVLEKQKPTQVPVTTPVPEIAILTEPLAEPVQEQVVTEHDVAEQIDPDALQIVFLGDSIFDNNRDETGIAYRVGVDCDATVYNLSIGGTSASMEEGEPTGYEQCTSRGLIGIALMLAGTVEPEQLQIQGTRAEDAMKRMKDPGNTDYFIVEFGINDFFRVVPLSNEDYTVLYDTMTYVGALRLGVELLRSVAPDATIILCSPHYCQFFHDDVMVGDGNILNNGYGTLYDYKGICEYVSNEKNTLFMNSYEDLGINGYTAEEYLDDGVHLTAAGRKLYGEYLAKMIMNYEETKNN